MKKIAIFLALIIILGSLSGCNNGVKPKEPDNKVEENPVSETEKVSISDTKYLEEFENKAISVPFQPTDIKASIEKYEISADLSNIENIEIFGEFTEEQKAAISKNGFFISPTGTYSDEYFQYDQIFNIYEQNEYMNIPNFVTGDAMTHTFHVFYTNLLRNLEKNELYEKLTEMTKSLLNSNIETYESLTNEKIKALQLKNVAYFATASKLLGLDLDYPAEAREIVEEELNKIEGKSSVESGIVAGNVDYSQFTVRGHYTRDEVLEKYFLGTMFYGQLGFKPFGEINVNEDMIIQGFLITDSIYKDKEIFKAWAEVTDPIDFLVETSEDITIRDYGKILYGVYGEKPDLNKLDEKLQLDTAIELIKELPDPLIAPDKGKSFRFIPQRAVMDNVLMQNLVDVYSPSKRPIYSGLDMMATLGSNKAKEIQESDPYNKIWAEYPERLEENIENVKALPESAWQKNLYRGWLWTLKSYTKDFGEGYPMFMQNDSWKKKDLVSALGSYAELKHDTILYSKQVTAEMGGGAPVEYPNGYVEPNLELFEKISWLLEYTNKNLIAKNLMKEDDTRIDSFKELVDDCIVLIKKELNGEPFTETDKQFLMYIGGELEVLSYEFSKKIDEDEEKAPDDWYEIEDTADKRMPLIADLMMVAENVADIPQGKFLSIGTGTPSHIYVVYPRDGKLYMGRGGIFSYYEFLSDKRMTDEEWQLKLLSEGEKLPTWYSDLVLEGKGDVPGGQIDY